MAQSCFGLIGGGAVMQAWRSKVKDYEGRLLPAAQAGADILEENMVGKSPYLTGELEGSIDQEVLEATDESAVVGVGPNVIQGLMQEFGTKRHGAQPFMRPALQENKEAIVEAVKDKLASSE